MRLFALLTVAYAAAAREPIESGVRYHLSGWNPKCDKMPAGCTNGAADVVELNSCLIDHNLGCPSTFDVTVDMNEPKFSIVRTQNGGYTIVFTLEKPLFPGGWRLSSGTITHRTSSFPQGHKEFNLDNSTLVYKQVAFEDIDFAREDLTKWHRLNCNVTTPQQGTVINHHIKCSDHTHGLMKYTEEVTFAIIKHMKPVNYQGLDAPWGDMTLHRSTRASKISQISQNDTTYVIQWHPECKDIPEKCTEPGLTKQGAIECVETYRKPGCEVDLGAFITKSQLNPIELQMNGADYLVEGVYIDPFDILPIDMSPKIKWSIFTTVLGFPAIDADNSHIYVSPNLGDFSGRLDDIIFGGYDSQDFYDVFDLSQPGGTFIYLTRPITRSWIPMFRGEIGIVSRSVLNTTQSTVKKSLRGQQEGDI